MACLRAARAAGLVALFVLAGCRTVAPLSAAAPPPALSREDLHFAQALAHYTQGLLTEVEDGRRSVASLEQFSAASQLDPSSGRVLSKLAVTALQLNQPDRAILALKQACDLDPRSEQAWLDLATGYQLAGRLKDAEKAYARAARLAPQMPTAYLALANLFFYGKREKEALQMLDRGIRKTGQADPFLNFCSTQGLRFFYGGETLKAIACFAFAAERKTDERAKMYYLIGELYETLQRKPEAIGYYTLASRLVPPFPQAFVKLALLQYETSPKKALEILQEGDRRSPDNLLILLAMGEFYASMQRYADAVNVYDRMTGIAERAAEPKLTEDFYLSFGITCEKAGMTNKSEQVFEKCLALYPAADAVLNYLAYSWAERGERLETALTYVKRALEKEPESGAYVDTLGWILYKQGNYVEALLQIRKAADLMKDDPVIVEHLGDVLKALNRTEEAVEAWKRSFLRAPDNGAVAAKLKAHAVNPAALLEEAARQAKQRGEAAPPAPAKSPGPSP